jgi:Sulfotransferase family
MPPWLWRFPALRSKSEIMILEELSRDEPSFVRRRLGYGGFISNRFKYFFMEIPKAGATVTKTLLWQIEQLGSPPLADTGIIHRRPSDDPRPSPLTVPIDAARTVLFSKSYYRFSLWRDPVRRLASAYVDKIYLGRSTKRKWTTLRKSLARKCGVEDPRDIGFDWFADFVCSQQDEDRDLHWMSQWRLSLSDYLKYNQFVDLDNYAADMTRLFDEIGVPQDDRPDFRTRLHASGSEKIEISERTAKMIRSSYAQDYLLSRQK